MKATLAVMVAAVACLLLSACASNTAPEAMTVPVPPAASPNPALAGALTAVLGRKPTVEESQTARKLFARAIETPGGLKVQTIHAFC